MVTAGLSDDDLRETAYEVLLVSVGAAGYSIVLSFLHPYLLILENLSPCLRN